MEKEENGSKMCISSQKLELVQVFDLMVVDLIN
jgi:hypothetical protein